MTESAGEQITDYVSNRPQPPETDSLATDDADEPFPPRTSREGLPRNFRMRHDAHYVDELMSRPTDPSRALNDDPRPGRRVEPLPSAAETAAAENTGVRPGAATPALAPMFSLIADRLESAVAHAGIRDRQATTSLIASSVQAELARIARVARAAAVIHDDRPPMRRDIAAREIADAVMSASAPIARLFGMECGAVVDDPEFTIVAEPALVLQAVAGTVDALIDLLFSDPRRQPLFDGRHPAMRISINLRAVRVRPALFVDVFCPALVVSSRQAERVFDGHAEDYPMAPAAGLLLSAAARIVRAHDGRAEARRHPDGGLTITYVFPQIIGESRLN